MKNIIVLILCSILIFVNSNIVFSKTVEKNTEENTDLNVEEQDSNLLDPSNPSLLKGHISKVPTGTKLKIIIETPVDEITSMIGDEIKARISEDILVDGSVIVPAGSNVIGEISEINPAKRLHKAGSIRILFKNLITPDGREVPIVASVLSHSGLIKGKYGPKSILLSSATVVAPAAAGLGAGLAADGSALGAGVGATVGALLGLGLFAFQRGNKVDIKAGDELNIELTEEALIPKLLSSTASTNSEVTETESYSDGDNLQYFPLPLPNQ